MTYYLVRRYNEGTNSPFMARMFMGILELRNLIVMTNADPRNTQITQKQFDRLYDPIRNSLAIALEAARSLNTLSTNLIEAGQNGNLINIYPGGRFELINTQDAQLQKEFASVVEHSSVAIKNHLPKLLNEIYGINIVFLFQREEEFNKAAYDLKKKGSDLLAQYLKNIRRWSDPLIDGIWNQSKHDNWKLGAIGLTITTPPSVQVLLPSVFGVSVNQYSIQVVNYCCLLVEDLIAYGLQDHRYSPICLKEISKENRPRFENKRFHAYPKTPGTICWTLEFKAEIDIL